MTTWMQTRTGKAFDLLNPKKETVDVVDILHALNNIQRFTGHTRNNWSVADHTLLVCYLLKIKGKENAIPYGLLHDAHEAYLGDWSTPLKNALGNDYAPLKRIEAKVAKAIHDKAGLEYPVPLSIQKDIHEADMLALMWERRDVLGVVPGLNWGDDLEKLACDIPEKSCYKAIGRDIFCSHDDLSDWFKDYFDKDFFD